MVFGRHRLPVAIAVLLILTLIGLYSFHSPIKAPLSTAGAKIASAKERLEHSLEEQNRGLKHALEVARASLKQAEPTTTTASTPESKQLTTIDTDSFAYVFYATNDNYACSVLVNIYRLQNVLHTALAIHVLVSEDVSEETVKAISGAGGISHMQTPPEMPEDASGYYRNSLLKLRAFQMHILSPGLTRVLALDADQLILQNLDYLFTDLLAVDLAAPRAYWLGKGWLSTTFMMISPSDKLWTRVEKAIEQSLRNTQAPRFDMDIVNEALGDIVMMLNGEYVCLNSHFENWSLPRWYFPERELNWTTIKIINELAKPPPSPVAISLQANAKRQLFTYTDIAVEPPSTLVPVPQPAPQLHQQPQALSGVSALPSPPYPHLPDAPRIVIEPAESSPRFPLTHPLALELERLQDTAAVIYFSAVGKPWSLEPESVRQARLDAHPLLAEQFRVWRDTAEKVCPGGAAARPDRLPSKGPEAMMPLPEVTETVIIASSISPGYTWPTAGFGVPVSAG